MDDDDMGRLHVSPTALWCHGLMTSIAPRCSPLEHSDASRGAEAAADLAALGFPPPMVTANRLRAQVADVLFRCAAAPPSCAPC